jgi:hypothetical protein
VLILFTKHFMDGTKIPVSNFLMMIVYVKTRVYLKRKDQETIQTTGSSNSCGQEQQFILELQQNQGISVDEPAFTFFVRNGKLQSGKETYCFILQKVEFLSFVALILPILSSIATTL